MMTQPLPCCQYLPDESNRKLTRFGGLPLFIDMAIKSGLQAKWPRLLIRNLKAGTTCKSFLVNVIEYRWWRLC